jgi:hypothetical protein
MNAEVKKELESIKKNIEAECISQGEIAYLVEHQQDILELEDIELAQWAGISEAEWDRGELLTDDEAVCTWCGEIYDKSELKEELNLGYLCDHCVGAIWSRGETLYFKN